jgi:hypothetical protein
MKLHYIIAWCLIFNHPAVFALVTITRSGTYFFRGHIIGNPTGPDEAGIEVTVDNVVIDFGGYAVFQMPGNTQPGFKGIKVNDNITQVSIKNGVIQDVTGEGILIEDGCKNIHIDDMLVKNCDNGGICLDGLNAGMGIKNCIIKNCYVLSCTGYDGSPARGLYMSEAANVVITDCVFNDNDAQLTGSGFGIELVNCSVCKLQDCIIASNGGYHHGCGVLLDGCADCVIENCEVGQTIARSSSVDSEACGFCIEGSSNIVIVDCKSVDNLHTQNKAVGFCCANSVGIVFQDCLAEGQKGDAAAVGFEFEGSVCSSISQCSSKLNKTITSGSAYGILLTGTNNGKCSFFENSIEHNRGIDDSFGVIDERNPSTSLFSRNQAFNNGTNYDITYPVGISLPVIQASLTNSMIGLPTLVAGSLDNLDIAP